MHSRALAVLVLSAMLALPGCGQSQPSGPEFPPVLPISFHPQDPNVSIYLRLEEPPLEYDRALVLPLYWERGVQPNEYHYSIQGAFVANVTRSDVLESALRRRPGRDRVADVIVWIPGYCPVGIGKVFRMEWQVQGRTMTIMKLRRDTTTGRGDKSVARAMMRLLEGSSFIARAGGQYVDARYNDDVDALVVCGEYSSEYTYPTYRWADGTPREIGRFLLWPLPVGTPVAMRWDSDQHRSDILEFVRQVCANQQEAGPETGRGSLDPPSATGPASSPPPMAKPPSTRPSPTTSPTN